METSQQVMKMDRARLHSVWNDAHDTSDGKSPKENGRMEEIARRIVMFGVRKGN